MKVFSNVMKVFAALAAVAGIVYVVATYGDRIVEWAKDLCGKHSCCGRSHFCDLDEAVDYEVPQAPAQEAPAETPAVDPEGADDSDFED